jgi:hypothetical protein
MHQTTIRFPPRVWQDLEKEARVMGISAAQYVRDATVSRLAFTTGWRMALGAEDGASSEDRAAGDPEPFEALDGVEAMRAHAQIARKRARATREAARLIQVRSELARNGGVSGGE